MSQNILNLALRIEEQGKQNDKQNYRNPINMRRNNRIVRIRVQKRGDILSKECAAQRNESRKGIADAFETGHRKTIGYCPESPVTHDRVGGFGVCKESRYRSFRVCV